MGTPYTGVAAHVSLANAVAVTVPADGDADNGATFDVGMQALVDYAEAMRLGGSPQLSLSSGSFSTSSITYVDVTNLTLTLTASTTGVRPVLLALVSEVGQVGALGMTLPATSNFSLNVRLLRDGADIGTFTLQASNQGAGSQTFRFSLPFLGIDAPPAGAHTYKVQVLVTNATAGASVTTCQLLAYVL